MNILKIENLTKYFGKQHVLKGINLEITKPGIYALVGPNGAGKSTFFNIISNLLKSDEGKVTVLGKENTDVSIFYETSFLKDNSVLYEYLTGYDHLNFIANVQKIPKEHIDELVDKMNIAHYMNKKVGNYSLGMKQHLLITMSMLNNPKLMILDEPLNGLDPTSIIKVRNLLKELENNGTTILISSHTLSEIDLLTDNIIFLKNGVLHEEKIDIKQNKKYKISLEKSSIEKVSELKHDNATFTLDNNNLIVEISDGNISSIISLLEKNNIEFNDIEKIKMGTEERYIKMFPDEFKAVTK
ncbi:ABC transporter ATP-binding protein [Helcococcus kunzii]|uniref:ABC transporter ATP-binding protein n=1 Tax=Helcococcus kunzii TaxID=40091 RepID=UPI001BAFAAA3|nr:ABC transporter ATP-binding protein [Helcococcus kunzii]QUY65184.1 ABC transporter ATP-binding protein [Helcococcus kunzii]